MNNKAVTEGSSASRAYKYLLFVSVLLLSPSCRTTDFLPEIDLIFRALEFMDSDKITKAHFLHSHKKKLLRDSSKNANT